MCSLIACELYNPLLHGVCQKLTDVVPTKRNEIKHKGRASMGILLKNSIFYRNEEKYIQIPKEIQAVITIKDNLTNNEINSELLMIYFFIICIQVFEKVAHFVLKYFFCSKYILV